MAGLTRFLSMRAAIVTLNILIGMAAGAWFVRDWIRKHPQDVPWTALDLSHPTGRFTRSKLVQLGADPRLCRALLDRAGAQDKAAPPRWASPGCGYADGMRLSRNAAPSPGGLVTSCPVAAALLLWEERVLQPSAMRRFGTRVSQVYHSGSFSCRRLYGRDDGPFSEHATADAVDITGFRLADGRRISIVRDWASSNSEAAFLRDVRTGACDYFATVLSPDYNAAHQDHFHFDQADRSSAGWHLCR